MACRVLGRMYMGRLVVHRQRALGAFALKYHCFFGKDREAFMKVLEETPLVDRPQLPSDCTLKNGERVTVELGEQGSCFFVAVYLESRTIVTPTVEVLPGDSAYTIETDFDRYLGLSLRVVPGVE